MSTVTRRVTPDYVSVSDAAVLLGVGRSTVRRYVSRGLIEARRLPGGGGVRIPIRALNLPDYTEDQGIASRARHRT